jgi:hypothetical protein
MPRLAYIAGPTDVAGGLGETYERRSSSAARRRRRARECARARATVKALTPQAFDAQAATPCVLETTPTTPRRVIRRPMPRSVAAERNHVLITIP